MSTLANIRDRLSDDALYAGMGSVFRSVVFEYGTGIVQKFTNESYQAGENAKLELEVDIGDADVYVEGEPLPIPLESTTKSAGFDFKAFRSVIRETGHARRARGPQNEGLRIGDDEIMKCYRRIRDKIATTFDDAATYGIQGIISAGTYGFGSTSGQSLSRSTYAKLKSYEKNAAGPISTSLCNEAHYAAMDTPYGAEVDIYVASAKQCQKLAELGSGKMMVIAPTQGRALDLVATELAIGGRPVFMLPNLTNSVILGFSNIAEDWHLIWNEANPGRFHVLDLGADASDTPMNLQVSTSLAIACTSPNKQVKIYGLT